MRPRLNPEELEAAEAASRERGSSYQQQAADVRRAAEEFRASSPWEAWKRSNRRPWLVP